MAAAVALALGWASPVVAVGAGQDQLTVAGCAHPGRPRCGPLPSVTRGQAFYLLLRGDAEPPANSVQSFVDSSPCPTTYHAEAQRAVARRAAYVGGTPVGPGIFGTARRVSPTNSAAMPLGNDYVCSYLKELRRNPRRVTTPTYAHASTRLTVNP